MANPMHEEEFKFPDQQEESGGKEDDFEIEIEDDTPEQDRNREPLPQNLVDELENDELDEYSDKVKIRLKQMKKVWHDERREKEAASRERQEAIQVAQRLLEENKSLAGRYREGEKVLVDTYKSAADLELAQAKRSYKEAYDAGDSDKMMEAQDQLSAAQYKLQRAREYVPAPLQEEQTPVYQQPQVQIPKPDSKTLAWQERNKWFGTDGVMTGAALGLHNDLISQHGQSYATTDEYWGKIDATMRKSFPDRFSNETQPSNTGRRTNSTVVASASRSTSSKRVVLKQSELQIAKRLGLTPEQYAREKIKSENKNG
jgi:hypothetical protein